MSTPNPLNLSSAMRWCHHCHVGEIGPNDLRCWVCKEPTELATPDGAYEDTEE